MYCPHTDPAGYTYTTAGCLFSLSPLRSPFFLSPLSLTIQRFPDEGLANVVRNVFDFDSYNKDTREVLIEALHKHGIPIGAKPSSVHLAKE